MTEYRQNNRRENDRDIRLTAVESAVTHLDSRFHKMENTITEGFRAVTDRLNKQQEAAKPHVMAWAGWAAVILMVVGMFGSVIMKDFSRIEDELEKNRTSFSDPVQSRQIENNRIDYQNADKEIRNDIRHVYEELDARVHKNEERLFETAISVSSILGEIKGRHDIENFQDFRESTDRRKTTTAP